ncbi:MAG TPA: caspase family protein [Spirochaetia bacterium]|nr:caspase family protein [Spirochaetia bacterium]
MKRALLVGINDYPGTQNDLHGCVNDITNLYDVLVKYFGFASTDVVMLSDKRATKQAILDGLKSLITKSAAGDNAVFHYSGHGSQVRDTEGDELADGLDEIICPWDFDWDGTYIKDDDFAVIFSGLAKGVSLEVILDSCHSGTGTREMIIDRTSLRGQQAGLLDEKTLWASSHCIRPRYLAPPADIALRADDIFGDTLKTRRICREGVLNHVLWAACRSDQYSADAEVGGKPGGAFTYFFCRHIRDTAGKVSRSDLIKLVRASLKHEGFSQVPQLECPEDHRKTEVFE